MAVLAAQAPPDAGGDGGAFALAVAVCALKDRLDRGGIGDLEVVLSSGDLPSLTTRSATRDVDVRRYVGHRLYSAYRLVGLGAHLRFDWVDSFYLGVRGADFARAVSVVDGADWSNRDGVLAPTSKLVLGIEEREEGTSMPGYSDDLAKTKAVAAGVARLAKDPVTGTLGRAAFNEDLDRHITESVRSGEPLVLVMADVDHFKRINDTHGHQHGDAVLRGVADRLEAVARRKGIVYRYGGEEFAIVLPNHGVEEGIVVAERARNLIAGQPIEGLNVTMSFGVACVTDHATDSNGIVAAADTAMYDAKKKGRNLVRVFGEPEPERQTERKVVRRLPEPDQVTEEQRAELRHRLVRDLPVYCPRDGAPFDVEDATAIGSAGRDFLLICRQCGLLVETQGVDR